MDAAVPRAAAGCGCFEACPLASAWRGGGIALGILLAAPAMIALRRAGKNSAVNYLLLGMAVGVLLESCLGVLAATAPFAGPLRLGGVWGAGIGLWSSAMWCLFFRGRPKSFNSSRWHSTAAD